MRKDNSLSQETLTALSLVNLFLISIRKMCSIYQTEFLSQFHLYSVKSDKEKKKCLNVRDLMDFYPLPSYMKEGCEIILLKHSVFSH